MFLVIESCWYFSPSHIIHHSINTYLLFIIFVFQYHLAIARYVGELARELADSLIIPFDVTEYPKRLKEYADDIEYYYGPLIRRNGLARSLGMFT